MTKLTRITVDRMCVVELATALDLVGNPWLHPHGFRAFGGRVVWTAASTGGGKLVRIQRIDGMKTIVRYVHADAQFEVIGDFDDLVFIEPPA